MFVSPARRRARLAASIAATMGLFAGAAAISTGPAQSAVPPTDCPAAFPVADLNDGDLVTGKTVVEGTTPVPFDGEVLGVIQDGIAPDLDMIMVRVDIDALNVPNVHGIWAGMSGSPVYSSDNRLIGAVAYGLIWGETNVAGVTPFEEMDDYLPGATMAGHVQVSKAQARQIAEDTDVTAAQAAQGFHRLGVPTGVSGMTRGFAKAQRMQKDRGTSYLYKNTYKMGAARPAGVAPDESTITAGGNLAASLSSGTITMGGVGTATCVKDGSVVGFGHPATFAGETTMGLHPADALYIQQGGAFDSPFKVANFGAAVGIIDEDHLTGITGTFGGTLPVSSVDTDVTYLDHPTRSGHSEVSVKDATAATTFYQHVAMHDRAIDAIKAGSELLTFTVTGQDNGEPFTIGPFEDRYASDWDIAFESPWDVADIAWYLSSIKGVTIDGVDTTAAVIDDSSTWQVVGVEQYLAGEWVKVSRHKAAIAHAGKALKIRALLESDNDQTRTVPLTLDVPAKAAGSRGGMEVIGGSWLWNYRRINSVDDVQDMLANRVRNDAVQAQLELEGPKDFVRRDDVSDPTEKVVGGRKFVRVKVL